MGTDRFNYLRGNEPRTPDEVPLVESIRRAHGLPGADRYTGRVSAQQFPIPEQYHQPLRTENGIEKFARRTRTPEQQERERKRQERVARRQLKKAKKNQKVS